MGDKADVEDKFEKWWDDNGHKCEDMKGWWRTCYLAGYADGKNGSELEWYAKGYDDGRGEQKRMDVEIVRNFVSVNIGVEFCDIIAAAIEEK